MAECYECGNYVVPGQGIRREVETGRNSNISFTSKGRMRSSSGTRYGKRTICASCARAQDEANAFAAKVFGFIILALIGFVVFAALTEDKTPAAPVSLISANEKEMPKECERYGFPCQLNNIIVPDDWTKIKSGLIFSAGFDPSPIDVKWENPESGNSGQLRFMSIDRNKCISYELVVSINYNETKHSLTACKNDDGTLSIE